MCAMSLPLFALNAERPLTLSDQLEVYAYDHIDLPEIKPVVTRVNIHSGDCPCCGKRIAGGRRRYAAGSPFGPDIVALVIYLHTATWSATIGWWRC